MTEKNKSPIFVVGPPRGGTTLLSAMLSAHSNLDCGPETQFFEKITSTKLKECIEDPDWPALAVDNLLSLSLSDQSVAELFQTSEGELRGYLSSKPACVKSMFEGLTQLRCEKKNKIRWIEKTPSHLLHLSTIREIYPEAFVIFITRDPRDSANSISKLPWAFSDPKINSLLIRERYAKCKKFIDNDKLSISIKYEELVASPKETLIRLCNFIGEEFEDNMINTEYSGKEVASKNEPWKNQVSDTLDISRCYYWKKTGSSFNNWFIENSCRAFINANNYEITTSKNQFIFSFVYIFVLLKKQFLKVFRRLNKSLK